MGGSSKLAQPRLETARVRTRLSEALDCACERPIAWIAGPAGSGKSTALASYVSERRIDTLWYEVDARDDDVASLFHFLDEGIRAHVRGPQPPLPVLAMDDPIGSLGFARRYFEALFARIEAPFLLVFDDCHVLPSNHRWYDLLREGFAAIPAGITVVLLSRRGPPAAFSRLLATSRLSLMGWEQLRFTPDEAAELIRSRAEALGLILDSDQVLALQSQSDGWPAGLVLALERARINPMTLGTAGEGQPMSPELFDYFAAEVLAAAPREVRTFLMKSALLPGMTGATLDRLLDRQDAEIWLARIEHDNFFISVYAADSGPYYRYHPLFRRFLLAQLQRALAPEDLLALRRKAGECLRSEGEAEAAFELFGLARDHESAAAVLVSEAPRLLSLGRARTVAAWGSALPEEMLTANHELAFWAGMAELGGNPRRSVALLQNVLGGFEAAGDAAGYWAAWCGLVQGHSLEASDYRALGDLLSAAEQAERHGLAFPSPEIEARVMRTRALAAALFVPAHPQLEDWLASMRCSTHRDPEELWAACVAYGTSGRLPELRSFMDYWRLQSQQRELGAPFSVFYAIAESVHALLSGDFAGCSTAADTGLVMAERSGFFPVNEPLLMYSAIASLELGDTESLSDRLEQLAFLSQNGRWFGMAVYHVLQCRIALAAGDVERAALEAERSRGGARYLGLPLGQATAELLCIEVSIVRGRLEEASSALIQVKEMAVALGPFFEQRSLLLEAELAGSLGDVHRSHERLEQAMVLGARWGFIPVLCPRRSVLSELCRTALEHSIEPDYVRAVVYRLALKSSVRFRSGVMLRVEPHLAPSEFSKAVRQSLRALHETRKLARSPLLESWMVVDQAGFHADLPTRIAVLQRLLREQVQLLFGNGRTEPLARALHYTFVEPTGSQLLAAERACMSYGTYRRHLAAGLAEIVSALWLREQSRGSRRLLEGA